MWKKCDSKSKFPLPLNESHNLMCCYFYAWAAVTKYVANSATCSIYWVMKPVR